MGGTWITNSTLIITCNPHILYSLIRFQQTYIYICISLFHLLRVTYIIIYHYISYFKMIFVLKKLGVNVVLGYVGKFGNCIYQAECVISFKPLTMNISKKIRCQLSAIFHQQTTAPPNYNSLFLPIDLLKIIFYSFHAFNLIPSSVHCPNLVQMVNAHQYYLNLHLRIVISNS